MAIHNIFAADIGGTTSRFGWFCTSGQDLSCIQNLRVATTDADSFPQLLAGILDAFPPFKTDLAVLAVAGAVQHNTHASLPNISWDIDVQPITRFFPTPLLINDFEAQAYGCTRAVPKNIKILHKGSMDPNGPLAVIGAGTGLGHCALINDKHGGNVAVPSEAGHAAFAFYGIEEMEYMAFLHRETGTDYASADMVVSGPGLSRLHRFLTNEILSPHQVAARFDISSPTLAWFARFYARVCRHYSLTVLPTAGLYISGGLAIKNPIILKHPAFRTEFLHTSDYKNFLETLPIMLNTDEGMGLWGAAEYGRQYLCTHDFILPT